MPDLARGKVPEDWWYFPVVARLHGERVGYETQKPEALLRRVIQARTLAPITSVAGRKGYLRGQLMRDQDTGEYLVQALGGAPGASSHLLATLAEANCLVVVPSEAEQIRTGEVVDVAFLAQRG